MSEAITQPQPAETDAPNLCDEALALIKWQEEHPDAWGDQDENGVDLARLRENLKRSPAERLRQMDFGYQMLMAIKNARTPTAADAA